MPTATATKPRTRKPKEKQEAPQPTNLYFDLMGTRAGDLFKALRLAAPIASNDDFRVILCGLHLVSDGRDLVIEATDSYRLLRVTLTRFNLPEFDVVVDARWLVRNLPKGKVGVSEVFGFRITDTDITLTDHRESTSATKRLTKANTHQNGYPNLNPILAGLETGGDEVEGNEKRAFNPQYLSSILVAAHKFGGDANPVRVRQLDLLKPCRFDVVNHEVGTLTAILMPVRVA